MPRHGVTPRTTCKQVSVICFNNLITHGGLKRQAPAVWAATFAGFTRLKEDVEVQRVCLDVRRVANFPFRSRFQNRVQRQAG
jgi:hypothetical protein